MLLPYFHYAYFFSFCFPKDNILISIHMKDVFHVFFQPLLKYQSTFVVFDGLRWRLSKHAYDALSVHKLAWESGIINLHAALG